MAAAVSEFRCTLLRDKPCSRLIALRGVRHRNRCCYCCDAACCWSHWRRLPPRLTSPVADSGDGEGGRCVRWPLIATVSAGNAAAIVVRSVRFAAYFLAAPSAIRRQVHCCWRHRWDTACATDARNPPSSLHHRCGPHRAAASQLSVAGNQRGPIGGGTPRAPPPVVSAGVDRRCWWRGDRERADGAARGAAAQCTVRCCFTPPSAHLIGTRASVGAVHGPLPSTTNGSSL